MSELDPLELAKRIVQINRRRTRDLYGRKDAPVIQFPVQRNESGLVDLGLRVSYRRTEQVHKPHKRPRVSEEHVLCDEEAGQDSEAAVGEGSGNSVGSQLEHGETSHPTETDAAQSVLKKTTEVTQNEIKDVGEKVEAGAVIELRENALRGRNAASNDKALAIALAEDRPSWHPPWKMFRGISGHLGWVRSVAVDATNEWFATGSADRTVKIWDLASGRLRLTLTGHIATVRGIAISERHPYMFTVGEDKTVKCWDLEQNKVIRNYHGHLSGVYCVSLHPTLDVLMTGGRDSTIRVWDVRTRAQIFVLGGHRDTVNALFTQEVDPQIVSASVDSTVRTWDLAAGKCSGILTNHKKGVRALARHSREFSFASASADNIKTWALPNGDFMRNLSGGQHNEKLVNALAVNDDGVLVSGGDDGSLGFWDYAGAHCFQTEQTIVQPGSLDCEAGIYALSFDRSGSRLITCEADKTIKMWKEDDSATEETHPLHWKPDLNPKRY